MPRERIETHGERGNLKVNKSAYTRFAETIFLWHAIPLNPLTFIQQKIRAKGKCVCLCALCTAHYISNGKWNRNVENEIKVNCVVALGNVLARSLAFIFSNLSCACGCLLIPFLCRLTSECYNQLNNRNVSILYVAKGGKCMHRQNSTHTPQNPLWCSKWKRKKKEQKKKKENSKDTWGR